MYAWRPGVGKLVNAFGTNYATAIPGAADILPGDNLREAAGLDVSDFDEGRAEEDDIWRMPGCM